MWRAGRGVLPGGPPSALHGGPSPQPALTSMLFLWEDSVASMAVMQLPPSESRSTVVIIELRYGTWVRRLSASATITCSR